MIYEGIDVAKHKHQVAIIDNGGEIYEHDLVIYQDFKDFMKNFVVAEVA
ncbi:hypothetical protein JNUCC74_05240 [Cerasibacillus sp. JNUCC 74]